MRSHCVGSLSSFTLLLAQSIKVISFDLMELWSFHFEASHSTDLLKFHEVSDFKRLLKEFKDLNRHLYHRHSMICDTGLYFVFD